MTTRLSGIAGGVVGVGVSVDAVFFVTITHTSQNTSLFSFTVAFARRRRLLVTVRAAAPFFFFSKTTSATSATISRSGRKRTRQCTNAAAATILGRRNTTKDSWSEEPPVACSSLRDLKKPCRLLQY